MSNPVWELTLGRMGVPAGTVFNDIGYQEWLRSRPPSEGGGEALGVIGLVFLAVPVLGLIFSIYTMGSSPYVYFLRALDQDPTPSLLLHATLFLTLQMLTVVMAARMGGAGAALLIAVALPPINLLLALLGLAEIRLLHGAGLPVAGLLAAAAAGLPYVRVFKGLGSEEVITGVHAGVLALVSVIAVMLALVVIYCAVRATTIRTTLVTMMAYWGLRKTRAGKAVIVLLSVLLLAILERATPHFFDMPLDLHTYHVVVLGMLIGWRAGGAATVLWLLAFGIGLPFGSKLLLSPSLVFGPLGGFVVGLPLAAMTAAWSTRKKDWGLKTDIVFAHLVFLAFGSGWLLVSGSMDFGQLVRGIIAPTMP